MIQSLLIANRGEIACRIMRTARRMGLRTIAVYSDTDEGGRHVRAADSAVHIGPAPARDSYLAGDKIIDAARGMGADAIHPGYGFLAENAAFAQDVIDAGLTWVGPSPASIRAMGAKDAAKELMAKAGVPVTPGYHGEDQTPERLLREAEALGYPVLIKAAAGGGGKGMRRVDDPADFEAALAACRREAAAAFGDGRVLIETYIERPRHIEVQVFGDTHGNIIHLFERDCSLQRRYQKVLEEAPAPGMDAATRDAICAEAVRAARAVDYIGAGTVEFIADARRGLSADRIWFMEMNTRLQVEHTVTEEITGIDLVEWQLRVARGEPLPKRQEDIAIEGHAVELRVYAENVAHGFLPSTGLLEELDLPDAGVRVDSGVERGDAITPHYDPLMAKLIAREDNRDAAIETLKERLDETLVWPVRTNTGFLFRVMDHPDFVAGNVDTGFLERHLDALIPPAKPQPQVLSAALDQLSPGAAGRFEGLRGFRLNAPVRAQGTLWVNGDPTVVLLDGKTDSPAHLMRRAPHRAFLIEAGEPYLIETSGVQVARGAGTVSGTVLSPLPGRVIAVDVEEGANVVRGQRLVTLEAMKMEHTLVAPFDGVVTERHVVPGAQVTEGQVLLRIEPDAET